jgi:hypothetical protein
MMKRRKGNTWLMVGLTLAILVFVVTAVAQDEPPNNMQIFIEKVKADKKLLVAENMQLNDTEAKAFWPVYEQYQNELFLLRVRTLKLIQDYTAAYEKMSNTTARKLLNEYMTIEALRLKLGEAYLPKFKKVLSDVKVLRFYQLENKINVVLYYELAARIPLIKA